MTHRDLDSLLRQLVILGALAVLLIPAARGSSALLGWLPLWLVGMPLEKVESRMRLLLERLEHRSLRLSLHLRERKFLGPGPTGLLLD